MKSLFPSIHRIGTAIEMHFRNVSTTSYGRMTRKKVPMNAPLLNILFEHGRSWQHRVNIMLILYYVLHCTIYFSPQSYRTTPHHTTPSCIRNNGSKLNHHKSPSPLYRLDSLFVYRLKHYCYLHHRRYGRSDSTNRTSVPTPFQHCQGIPSNGYDLATF